MATPPDMSDVGLSFLNGVGRMVSSVVLKWALSAFDSGSKLVWAFKLLIR